MGCFCSKQANARVFDDMYDLALPTLISQLHGNPSTLIQLSNQSSDGLKIIKDMADDDEGKIIRLYQSCDLQLTPIEANMKNFVFEREGIIQEIVANKGDAVLVMPFGTMPDVVLIEQGCHLSIGKIIRLLEFVTLRLTGLERYRWQRRRFRPVSMLTTRWGPEHELP